MLSILILLHMHCFQLLNILNAVLEFGNTTGTELWFSYLINWWDLTKTDKPSHLFSEGLLVLDLMNNSIQKFHQNYSLINNYLQIAFGSASCFTMRRKNSKQSEPLQEYQQGGHFSWDDVRTHYIPNNKRFWKVSQRERIPDPGGMFR